MLEQIRRFCQQNQLIQKDSKVLLAVSGGMDSMVLLYLMKQMGAACAAAHCNFQLRGDESDKDEALVQRSCEKLGVPFHSTQFGTDAYAKEHKLSIQQAARVLRYRWFKVLCSEYGYQKIATAHHASDQVETILYNLSKGCGISGLRGIPLVNERIIRPMLFASRKEIEDFAAAHKIVWREDASNASDKYSRNMIRHAVVPKLREINPGLDSTMQRNAYRYRALEQLLAHQVEQVKSRYLREEQGVVVLANQWLEAKGSFAVLEAVLAGFGFNFEQIYDVHAHYKGQAGKRFLSADYELCLDRDSLILIKRGEVKKEKGILLNLGDTKVEMNGQCFACEVRDASDFDLIEDNKTACLNFNALTFPLKLRSWKRGDYFFPLGMKHRKKLSDFMIDQKVPLNLKPQIVLLESAGEIAWVAGYRIDERFKLRPDSKQVLIIRMSNA